MGFLCEKLLKSCSGSHTFASAAAGKAYPRRSQDPDLQSVHKCPGHHWIQPQVEGLRILPARWTN